MMCYDKHSTIEKYIEEKIRMLEDEREHFELLDTERDVDQYAHDIIVRKL